MAQWVRVLVTKPGDLNLIPRPHVVKDRTNFYKLSFNLQMCAITYVHAFAHTSKCD